MAETIIVETDIAVIGGGAAGCYAAMTARRQAPELDVLIIEKAHVDRSGCLAGGMNAINAYINPGETVDSFVEYVRFDAMGILREDLVRTQAALLNEVVRDLEQLGLPVVKDASGQYAPRGRWNIKIHGESLKPLLATAVRNLGARILNRVVVTNLLVQDGRVSGCVGFGLRDGNFYVIRASKTIVATGGASGLYRPNNEGEARHKMWYSPFNTGAGYAIGIRAGAEMTSFEHRFIALRTKETIAPTGTLALGFGAPQVNALGEEFMKKRWSHVGGEGAPTPIRLYAPLKEMAEGRGPCYMDTRHLSPDRVKALKEAYLDMYPNTVQYWAANDIDPSRDPIEICGTEPYLVGGHCQAGYWIDADRKTTLENLFAAGDVAGGAPYKFVSGCFAEGRIASESAVREIREEGRRRPDVSPEEIDRERKRTFSPLESGGKLSPGAVEERLQKIMDEYAGGIRTQYAMNETSLQVARKKLEEMTRDLPGLAAGDMHELMNLHEVLDRIDVARVLVAHLIARKETRWPGFQTRLDYPETREEWNLFVNSASDPDTGEIRIVLRPLDSFSDSVSEPTEVAFGNSY
ncbi:MAG: adenylyl-sulfate reductase subunit alpha [Nitrospirae bacterium]|jgi:adenylylsulfate reductase subunit A|nr:adenylyl-sulfate reductase subunit alpha [Nitrospirota bacterium]